MFFSVIRPNHGFDAILPPGRQSGRKLQCLIGNRMAKNFFKILILHNL